MEANAPQQATPAPTPDILEEQIHSTTVDELDHRIALGLREAIQQMQRNQSVLGDSRARYGDRRTSDTFVMDIQGVLTPVRFGAGFDVDFYIDSSEEFPLVTREYVAKVRDQVAAKGEELARHFRRRFFVKLREEMVTHSLEESLRSSGIPVDEVQRWKDDGRFAKIVELAIRKMDEALAVVTARIELERLQRQERERRSNARQVTELTDAVLRAEPAMGITMPDVVVDTVQAPVPPAGAPAVRPGEVALDNGEVIQETVLQTVAEREPEGE